MPKNFVGPHPVSPDGTVVEIENKIVEFTHDIITELTEAEHAALAQFAAVRADLFPQPKPFYIALGLGNDFDFVEAP